MATFFFFFSAVSAVSAATLTLDPTTSSVAAGRTFTVKLVLTLGSGEKAWGYDAQIQFPSNLLTYNQSSFVKGTVFSGQTTSAANAWEEGQTGNVAIGEYFNGSDQLSVTTGGVVGTLSFTAKQTTGTGNIIIVCSATSSVYAPGGLHTNLFTTCSSLNPRDVVTVSGGTNPTATPGPSSTPAPTPTTTGSSSSSTTPTPAIATTLPDTGTTQNTIMIIGSGVILLGLGYLLKLKLLD